jgi:4,5-DOPA dioxygenase extradiol
MDEELQPQGPVCEPVRQDAIAAVTRLATTAVHEGRMPAIYLGHGAPPLVDDELWVSELATWALALPRPKAIFMVSAHWQAAPLTLGATREAAPLVYDFYGFPERYYQMKYPSPGAPDLAARVRELLAGVEEVVDQPDRGLDHGAFVPLLVMYPQADVPVLQISMPALEPARLLEIGARLRPLRDEGVLLIGSGFLTHGLPFLRDFRVDAAPPEWSSAFDAWAEQALAAHDFDALARFREVPSARFAHPSTEHFVPLFVTLGAADDEVPVSVITGYWLGLSKRSIQVA